MVLIANRLQFIRRQDGGKCLFSKRSSRTEQFNELPQGFGVRQPSGASASVANSWGVARKAAEDCRTPRRFATSNGVAELPADS
jgi:hypothetical protein